MRSVPCRYPVRYVKDGKKQRVRQETYGGTNVLVADSKTALEVVPRVRSRVCVAFDVGDALVDAAALPDLRGWTYGGEREASEAEVAQVRAMRGDAADASVAVPTVTVWRYDAWHERKHVQYEFSAVSASASVSASVGAASSPAAVLPLSLRMHGNNAFTGAHFDDWIVTYTSYAGGDAAAPETEFAAPPECDEKGDAFEDRRSGAPSDSSSSSAPPMSPSLARWLAHVPRVRYAGDSAYDAFLDRFYGSADALLSAAGLPSVGAAASRRRPSSAAEYLRRAEVHREHAALIEAHNARHAAGLETYSMAMNALGDLSQDEWLGLVMPRALRRARGALRSGERGTPEYAREVLGARDDANKSPSSFKYELPYAPRLPLDRLPSAVDWSFRNSRASVAEGSPPTAVKDQATCGSCWAFGATAAVEGAWLRATGERVLLSEQQVLDCSWGADPRSIWSNGACDGGEAYSALEYVAGTGGLATLEDYPYLGADNYCASWSPYDNKGTKMGQGRDDEERGGANGTASSSSSSSYPFISGWTRVPQYDERALREAVYSHGVVAVAIDASRPGFRFYSGGVYTEAGCKHAPDELDHIVSLEGYGSDPFGGPYWLLRNSWSSEWGDGGYIKMGTEHHGCGVTADAVFAVVTAKDLEQRRGDAQNGEDIQAIAEA